MEKLCNIQIYSDVKGIFSIDGMRVGETPEPICVLMPARRLLVTFAPLMRAMTGFYLGFSRIVDISEIVPVVTENDGVLCLTQTPECVIVDVNVPFIPEQPCVPHILSSAQLGRIKAYIYWDRWIAFAAEDAETGEVLAVQPFMALSEYPRKEKARIFFERRGNEVLVFGAYKGHETNIACILPAKRKCILHEQCADYSVKDGALMLKYDVDDPYGTTYIAKHVWNGSEFKIVEVLAERSSDPVARSAKKDMHALACACMAGAENAAMGMLSPGLRGRLTFARLKEYLGNIKRVELRGAREGEVLLCEEVSDNVCIARRARAEISGGYISDISLDENT